VFLGTKKALRVAVTAWEAEVRGHAPSAVGATVTTLLTMWLEARAHDWQPLTARDHRSRVRFITEDLGTVRLVDLDPLRIDAWLAQMRRRGVGQGAIRGRLSTFKAACSWGVSRRLLRSNPVADAAPRLAVVRRSITPEPEQVVALLQAAAEEDTRAALGSTRSGLAPRSAKRSASSSNPTWKDDIRPMERRMERHRPIGQTDVASPAWAAEPTSSPASSSTTTRGPTSRPSQPRLD